MLSPEQTKVHGMLTLNSGEKLLKITRPREPSSYRPDQHTPTAFARSTVPCGSPGITAEQHDLHLLHPQHVRVGVPKTLL